jgi:hypothetical protein
MGQIILLIRAGFSRKVGLFSLVPKRNVRFKNP